MYEVFALKYAEANPPDRDHFLETRDPHDAPHPIAYFLWVARSAERTVVIDTGFDAARAESRRRTLLRHPVEALAGIGVDAAAVETVILTHLHYDHAGTLPCFPAAEFVIQTREMAYAAGPSMRHAVCRKAFDADDVVAMIRALYASRVIPVDGDKKILPGISVHLIGGHSAGLQAVRVETADGPLVLAADAVHFYDNLVERNPFPIVVDVPAYMDGLERLMALTADPCRVIPGHDPAVLDLFPGVEGGRDTVRLDRGPDRPTPFAGLPAGR